MSGLSRVVSDQTRCNLETKGETVEMFAMEIEKCVDSRNMGSVGGNPKAEIMRRIYGR